MVKLSHAKSAPACSLMLTAAELYCHTVVHLKTAIYVHVFVGSQLSGVLTCMPASLFLSIIYTVNI